MRRQKQQNLPLNLPRTEVLALTTMQRVAFVAFSIGCLLLSAYMLWSQTQMQVRTVHCQSNILSACYVLADAESAPLRDVVLAAHAIIKMNDMHNQRRETRFYQTAVADYMAGYQSALQLGVMVDSGEAYNVMEAYEVDLRAAAMQLLDIVGTQEV